MLLINGIMSGLCVVVGAEGVLFSQKESVTCRIVNKQLEWKTEIGRAHV